MDIERENQMALQAAVSVFGVMFQKMSEPLEFEPLTGNVTMTDAERHQAINEGIDEMMAGTIKAFSGGLGEQLIRKGTRRRSHKLTVRPRTINIIQH